MINLQKKSSCTYPEVKDFDESGKYFNTRDMLNIQFNFFLAFQHIVMRIFYAHLTSSCGIIHMQNMTRSELYTTTEIYTMLFHS